MGTLNLSSIKRFMKHFSEWGLAWHNAKKKKKKKNHYYSFFPPSPFHFLQTAQLQLQTKQCHFSAKKGVLVFMPQTGILVFVPIPFIFLHFPEILLLPLPTWKQRDGKPLPVQQYLCTGTAQEQKPPAHWNAVLPLWAVQDYHRWGLTNVISGKFLQPRSQWTVCLTSTGNYWLSG